MFWVHVAFLHVKVEWCTLETTPRWVGNPSICLLMCSLAILSSPSVGLR